MGPTLKRLIECYRSDDDSDFPRLKRQVRVDHERVFDRLAAEHGALQLRNIRFRTLRSWYREWVAGGKVAMARSFVDRLREVFRFGSTILEDRECTRLFDAVANLPLEKSPVRSVQLTADHARNIRKVAREHFHWSSIALAQALQFEFRLSQKDVIGEWLPISEPGESDVVSRKYGKWFRGLRWEGLDENFIMRHRAGAGGRLFEADLKTAPMVMEELEFMVEGAMSDRSSLPMTGPVVLCDVTQWPWTTAEFRRKWRLVAKKAGVPANVTNRDSSPTGLIRGGPERAKVFEPYNSKRVDYILRSARRTSESSREADIGEKS